MIQLHFPCSIGSESDVSVDIMAGGKEPFVIVNFVRNHMHMFSLNLSLKVAENLASAIGFCLQDYHTGKQHPDGCMCGREDCPHTRYVTSPEGA